MCQLCPGGAASVSVPRILVVDGTRSFGRQVAGLADSLPDYPKVFALARPPELSDVIASDGPFDVLLAGPGVMTHDGINQLVDLRRRPARSPRRRRGTPELFE